MHVLWRVVVKEFLQLRRDRRMIPVIFVAPVLQIVVFGFAVNTDVTKVPLVLVDQDHTAASRDLVLRFVGSGTFELVAREDSPSAVEPWLVSGRAQVALVIAAGFAEEAGRGGTPAVQVIADGSDASPATVALGHAGALVQQASAELVRARVGALGRVLSEEGRPTPAPGRVEAVPRVFYNPDLKSRWFYVPAVLAMILMILTMLLSAMGVVREKEIGTLEQLMVTPIRPWQLLVGKLFPFGVIGLAQVFVITAVAVRGFGVPLRGSFLLLLLFSQLFIFSTLGLGLLVSTVVRTQQQAMMAATFMLMVPMVYLSGLIFPIENMPYAIQLVTYLIPARYYANVLRGVFLKGSGLDVLWPEAVVLLGMGLAILATAALRFRKRLD